MNQRGITYICVQYSMLSIKPLKEMLGKKGVVFIDNEKIFQNAVKKDGYEKYFFDIFGGYFGHCTNKGNKLLARNIAEGILKSLKLSQKQVRKYF